MDQQSQETSEVLTFAPRQNTGAPQAFDPSDELADKPLGWVPHNPQGTHQTEFAQKYGIPFEATQGGKDTTYPEYQLRIAELRAQPVKPAQGKR